MTRAPLRVTTRTCHTSSPAASWVPVYAHQKAPTAGTAQRLGGAGLGVEERAHQAPHRPLRRLQALYAEQETLQKRPWLSAAHLHPAKTASVRTKSGYRST